MNLWNEYTFWIIIVGAALLGLTAGVVGTFAVLRKESLIGDGLSHAALPGIALAFLYGMAVDRCCRVVTYNILAHSFDRALHKNKIRCNPGNSLIFFLRLRYGLTYLYPKP